jgi:hypothetical protein
MKQCCTPFQSSKLSPILHSFSVKQVVPSVLQNLTTFNAKVNNCLAPSTAMQRLKCFHLYKILEPHLATTLISAKNIVTVVEFKQMQARNVMCILQKI